MDGVRRPASGPARACLLAAAGALPPLAVATAWIPLRDQSSDVVVALLLVAVVASTGWTASRAAIGGATVAAAAAFTFFDTAPYDRFAFARQPDVATAVCLVAVGLLTGELAVRVARGRRAEGVAAAHLRRVRDAAAMVADGEEVVHLIGAVAGELGALGGVTGAEFSAEDLPERAVEVGRRWVGPTGGTGLVAVPVVALGRIVGHYLLRTSRSLDSEEVLLAVTLSDQVGAAIAAHSVPPAPTSPPGAAPRLRLMRNP